MPRPWILPLALISLGLSLPSHAEDKAAVARLQRADALTRLDDPTLKPWDLKVSYSIMDDAGKLAEQGTFEEWWAGPALYKRTVTSPSYTATTIVNKDGMFRTAGATDEPYMVEVLERQIVHPMPREGEMAGLSPQLQKPAPGGPPMDCVMFNMSMRNVPFAQIGLFPTYCMDPGKDTLVVSYDYGSLIMVRSLLGIFQARDIPTQASIILNRVPAASSQITDLKAVALTEANFVVPATGMEKVDVRTVQTYYTDLKPTQTPNKAPMAPASMAASVTKQPVQVHVRLGTDGHVHSVRLAATPDPILATSALGAVVRWSYQPVLSNGKPAEVDTTIPVTFGKPAGADLPGSTGKK